MKRDLVALGVPASKIYCDYAGFRTLDSVVRAKEVFGQDDYIVISQEFHARRAIFIGLSHDLDLLGFAAQPVTGMGSLRTEARECLARMRAILDVRILDKKPKFLGKTITIE
jgi:SanA protein